MEHSKKQEIIAIVDSYPNSMYYIDDDFRQPHLIKSILHHRIASEQFSTVKMSLIGISSISDSELQELGLRICGSLYEVERDGNQRTVKDSEGYIVVVCNPSNVFLGENYGEFFSVATNYLRFINVCVDPDTKRLRYGS